MHIPWEYFFLASISYILAFILPTYLGSMLMLTCSTQGSAFKNRAFIYFVDELPRVPFMDTKQFKGLAIGHVVFIKESERNNARLLRHELIHVRQEERYLGLFPILYLWEALRKGRKNNRFEIEAREKSKHPN